MILELLSLFFILRYQLLMMEKDMVLAWIKERKNKMCSAKRRGNMKGETEKSKGLAGAKGLGATASE